jgi:hypothetical protein
VNPELDAPEETHEARSKRHAAEKSALTSKVPGSLASVLRRFLAQGAFHDPAAPDPGNDNCMSATFEHNLARATALQMRALAIAMDSGIRGETNLGENVELSNEEAGLALAGLATTLEVGMWLAIEIRCAESSSNG